ncbi:MAG TPA: hypothetical protein VER03_23030 [Bryobacteraceae bacterium]|nr:hypothetical protein [Bryobacteraceae bacterium]
MSAAKISSYASLGLLCSMLQASGAQAAFTFLGPTPYVSAADSPFAAYMGGPNFYLEDFEDGELNTPGIAQTILFPLYGELGLSIVSPPGPGTDSVDADDGLVDGSGRYGHSLRTRVVIEAPMQPPILTCSVGFELLADGSGFFPKAFGFVWTDGPANLSLSMSISTSTGQNMNSPISAGLGDVAGDGATKEDNFFGIYVPVGIRQVTISGSYLGDFPSQDFIEIDHVQYGFIVAEPASGLGLIIVIGVRARRRR